MSISDINPMILILLALIILPGLGQLVALARRSSAARYDLRDADDLRDGQQRRR